MTRERVVEGGRREQGPEEEIAWQFDVHKVGSADGVVTSPTMKVFKEGSETDVTNEVTKGSMGVVGQIITCKTLYNLQESGYYVIKVKYTKDGNILTDKAYIDCPSEEE